MEPIETLNDDTICAVSTAPGRGGIAVIRVSGKAAFDVVGRIWRGKNLAQVTSHTAHLGTVTDSAGEALDSAVATVFKGPRSFTGEDTVEISVHGSPYIQRELLASLVSAGARIAGAGEFTRRAFANGRLDLAQAEAVADVIDSDTASQHRLAQAQMKGTFSKKIQSLHDNLLELACLLELELDFSEEDVEFASREKLLSLGNEILTEVNKLTSSYRTGNAVKNGIPVAIIGSPNAGKSTLLNGLLDDERAIVSDIPGTTRDTIEDIAVISGHLFRFIDTAGLRHTSDTIENIGISRAVDKMAQASIILWLVDPTGSVDAITHSREQLTQALSQTEREGGAPIVFTIINKSDVATPEQIATAAHAANLEVTAGSEQELITTFSGKSEADIQRLRALLAGIADERTSQSDDVIVTNLRHYENLKAAATDITATISALQSGLPADLVAQDLRSTLRHLASITGSITTPTLLSTIFSRFCIGK